MAANSYAISRYWSVPISHRELEAELATIDHICPFANGRYIPAGDGPVLAKLLPARDHEGRLIDIVGVEVTTTSPWWLRRGEAVILGADVLEYSVGCRWPVWLVSEPDEWLQLNGHAICVLNWSADLYPFLRQTELIIENRSLAATVRRVLTKQRGSLLDVRIWTYDDA